MDATPVLTPGAGRAPVEPAGDAPHGRRGGVWLAAAALLAAVLALAEWADRPPAPASADVPATAFSEARARPVLQRLAGDIGRRVIGTPGRDEAAAYLAATLAAIPGVEVQVQDHADAEPALWRPGTLELRRTRNVLARIRGDSATAVLVSAHYDSPPESPGAGDNAVSVATAVEVARALAAGPRPQHTVIFNFNDGEEAGLLGSDAFLEHPWAADVRAFVNLESAGPRGKAVLFQAGPGNDWLTEEYARSVPLPYGTVLGQDIFQSGIIPSDTDFRVYRDEGRLRGLDVALYQDGYAYHTALDRVERVQPGSVQHMGGNTLALVRELATGPLPGDVSRAPSIYYDFLGRTMFAYSAGTATLLALVAIVLALAAVAVAARRTPLTWGRALAGMGVTVLATLAGIVAAVLVGLLVGTVNPHGWYARPWLGWATFGATALAAFLFVHSVWARRGERRGAGDAALPALAGATLAWALLLALFTAAGIGTGYLALWWTLAGSLGLLAWAFAPRAWWAALLAAWVVPALLTAQVQTVLLKLAAPLAGRFPAGIPFDPVLALLVALPTVWLAAVGTAALHRGGRLRRASGVLAAAGLAGVVALALSHPYSAARPKRLAVQHTVTDTSSRLSVTGMDHIPASVALDGVPGPRFAPRGAGWVRPAERPALPAPPVSASPEGAAAGGERTVRLRIAPGGQYAVNVRIPAERLAGWSFSDSLPRLRGDGPAFAEMYVLRAYGNAQGWEGTLRIRGADPVEVEVVESYSPGSSPAIDQVVGGLPAWTTAGTTLARGTKLTI
ncbi:MAG: M28 family metallopeptidase [Gemmatimonadota bacterium]